jgi:trehalose 6-phosphate phosphatase
LHHTAFVAGKCQRKDWKDWHECGAGLGKSPCEQGTGEGIGLSSALAEFFTSVSHLTADTMKKLDQFFGALAGAARPLLLLDYDGTLAPFRVDRFKARPWAGVRELLTRIQSDTRTRIVVVTGRPAAEIVPLLGLERPPEVWGLHGSERLRPDGRRELESLAPAVRAGLDEARAQLQNDAAGGLLEEKPNAVAMHWRGVAPQKAKVIATKTRAVFEPLVRREGLVLLEFEAGLELRAGRDKGHVVKALLDETADGGSHSAAYLGDDITDEAAFRAIKGRGLAVLVKRNHRTTSADVWLRPPEELRAFFGRWLHTSRIPELDRMHT